MPTKLATTIRTELGRVADPARAPSMQAYMKSAMPFLGVASPVRRTLQKQLFADLRFADADTFSREVLGIWRGARYREERYVAIDLTGVRAARAFQTPALLPLYEEMIVTGAWWDYVDVIAAHRLGGLLAHHRALIRAEMLRWSVSEDLWKRRSAILCQLRFKEKTDLPLLHACIEPSLPSKEFFLRKAIGWALRQYGWHDPEEVRRYVRAHAKELSPLSVREALKNIESA
jgi:3-methyladenine DNA glycosylase AlkD